MEITVFIKCINNNKLKKKKNDNCKYNRNIYSI